MGQKASEDLHQLIHALEPAERRAFKLQSSRYDRAGGATYVALYEAIATQRAYDEEAIRRQFEGAAFLRNLSEAKAYLYKRLLRSLRASRGPESPETELREVLDHLEILFDKGLMEQAERQVRLGHARALQLDLHAFVAEFIRWQRRLAKWRAGKNLLQEMARLGEAEAEALRHLALEARLRDLMGRIQTILSQQADLVGEQRLAELRAIMADPALAKAPDSSGFHALSSYHYAHAYYHRAMADTAGTLESWQSVVQAFETHPAQLKRQPDQYANALVALIDSMVDNRRYRDVPQRIELLQAVPVTDASAVARRFFLAQHLGFRYAFVTGDLQSALHRVPDLEVGMAKHAKFMNASLEMALLYNMCALFFLCERYPEAQRYINQVLNRPHLPLREDIVDGLHLLEMVSRYARGQLDVLEHLLRAHERRVRHRAQRSAFVTQSNRFIARLVAAADHRETQAAMQEMDQELGELVAAGRPAGFDELQCWVRSRLGGVTMETILRREAAALQADAQDD